MQSVFFLRQPSSAVYGGGIPKETTQARSDVKLGRGFIGVASAISQSEFSPCRLFLLTTCHNNSALPPSKDESRVSNDENVPQLALHRNARFCSQSLMLLKKSQLAGQQPAKWQIWIIYLLSCHNDKMFLLYRYITLVV